VYIVHALAKCRRKYNMPSYSGLFDGEYGKPHNTMRKFPGMVDTMTREPFDIVPNDSANLSRIASGIYVGTGGELHFTDEAGVEHTLTVVAGWHPMRVIKVFATGTTADDMMGG
jgi:hypothetical protein